MTVTSFVSRILLGVPSRGGPGASPLVAPREWSRMTTDVRLAGSCCPTAL
jgi:hypothetical protein